MSDWTPPGRIDELPLHPGEAERAWAAVNSRRRIRTRLGGTAAGLALVALLVVGLLPSLSGQDDGGPVSVASGGRTPDRDPRALEVRPGVSNGDPARVGGGQASGPGGGSPGQVRPAAGPVTERTRPQPRRPKPAVERETGQTIFLGCVTRFCVSGRAEAEGDLHRLQMDLCLPVGGRSWRFSYSTAQEVDFVIAPQGEDPIWVWSAGQFFAAAEHHLDVGPGECVSWKTTWDRLDEQGRPADPGRYVLTVKTLAEQADENEASATTTFSVD